jgi:hypothetical protein
MMLAWLLVAAAAPAQPVLKPACQGALPQRIDAKKAMRPRKLNEEPAAVPIYTVLHTENGCTRPVPVGSRR